jgi:thiopeptide-type bacteriocin biosynthesis protein
VRPNGRRVWRSAHLFVSDPALVLCGDYVAMEVIAPFIRRWQSDAVVERWFFIRYGDHIRLRVFGDERQLDHRLVPALEAWIQASNTEVFVASRVRPDTKRAENLEPGDGSFRVVRVEWVPYTPEEERYGGPQGVALAEEIFHRSSDFALRELAGVAVADTSARLGKGLVAIIVASHVFFHSRAAIADFAAAYSDGYIQAIARNQDERTHRLSRMSVGFDAQAEEVSAYVEEIWNRLNDDESLSASIDLFQRELCGFRGRLRRLCSRGKISVSGKSSAEFGVALARIVPSYIHMTSNRLGISTAQEAYLSHILYRALQLANPIRRSEPSEA